GKLTANLVDLSVFNPVVRASGNENQVGGSLVVDWNGNGAIEGANNSGNLKLNLDKGRFGQLQALEAKIDAVYSPDGFNVPIVFFRSDKMDFQAVARTRGNTIEVDKIQLNQGN